MTIFIHVTIFVTFKNYSEKYYLDLKNIYQNISISYLSSDLICWIGREIAIKST